MPRPIGVTVLFLMHRRILSWLLAGKTGKFLSYLGPFGMENGGVYMNGGRDR